MGRVYRARHLSLGRIVALKLINPEAGAQLLARFREEACAVAQLRHPNIVQLYEFGTAGVQPYYALEYVDGGSLADHIGGRPYPPIEAAALIETVARAVHYSHTQGILHRDLKPGNILLLSPTEAGASRLDNLSDELSSRSLMAFVPKVTDFGLAKRLTMDVKLTRTGEVIGTPAYMAPEQASGVCSSLSPAVDVYALGAILYELFTGRPPLLGADNLQTVLLVLSLDPVSPRRLQPRLPRDLETICLKCLDKAPRRRYPSAADLADDLRRFLNGQPIRARPVRPWERLAKWARRRPASAALVAVSVGAVVALAAGAVRLQLALGEARTANDQLTVAISETEDTLRIAHEAVDGILVRLSDQLALVPRSEAVRRQSLEDARRLYERLAVIHPRNLDSADLKGVAVTKLGKIYHELGLLDNAAEAYGQSRAIYADLLAQAPDCSEYRHHMILNILNLVNVGRDREDWKRVDLLLAEAAPEVGRLLEARPGDFSVCQLAAQFRTAQGVFARVRQQLAEAEEHYRAALDLRQQAWQLRRDRHGDGADLASAHSNLGTALLLRQNYGESAAQFAAAEKLLAQTSSPRQRDFLGQIRGNIAVVRELQGQWTEATKVYQSALETFAGLLADFPSVPDYRFRHAKTQVNLAAVLALGHRPTEARQQLESAQVMLDRLVREFPGNAIYQAERDRCARSLRIVKDDPALPRTGPSSSLPGSRP
jgi:tetratricopeptide (TPR) repeat protein